MTPKEKFIAALERRPLEGLVPHFELVFYLTMEKLGKVHPTHRNYHQWDQMSETERKLHRNDMADVYIAIAQAYQHNAIFVHCNPGSADEQRRMLEIIREKTGDTYFLMLYCDPTYSIPDGSHMMEFIYRIADEPEKMKQEALALVDQELKKWETFAGLGLVDGFGMCSDYCFNTNPFLSPAQFSEYITPYLARTIGGLRDMGFYTIKHTDGNIMPVLDQLVQANPHAIHSLDPQAGVDIAKVKRMAGDKVCLIGNVNCGLLETGTDEEVIANARYALQNGMPDYGYIFSTSNCVYTGMPLSRYELIWKVWQEEGRY